LHSKEEHGKEKSDLLKSASGDSGGKDGGEKVKKKVRGGV
jgi:hypothetical protein